jgi:hypothetical protein
MALSPKQLLETLDLIEALVLSRDTVRDIADDLELVRDLSGQDRYEMLQLLGLDPVRLTKIANFQHRPVKKRRLQDVKCGVAHSSSDLRNQAATVSSLPEWTAGLKAWWAGVLADMHPVQIAAGNGMPLADSPQPSKQTTGVQKALVEIFGDGTLGHSLKWSEGFLRVMCVRMPDGLIRAVNASVHRSSSLAECNSSIILHFEDKHGGSATIELTPNQPMRAARNLSLRGQMSEIELTVLLREH